MHWDRPTDGNRPRVVVPRLKLYLEQIAVFIEGLCSVVGKLHQMTTGSRKFRGADSIAFAPPAAENHPLKVAQLRTWRVSEPVSNRRYTVASPQRG